MKHRKLSKEKNDKTERKDFFAHESAYIDRPCEIGEGTKIWHFCHIMRDSKIGKNCVLGQNVNISSGVVIGDNVKIQNNVSIYTGCIIEDDVFLGPSCVLTNITNPRSQIVRHGLFEKTVIKRGATVGANATIVCGIELGRYCFVAAGATVVKNVPDYALMQGVPAKQVGWMSRHGHRLITQNPNETMICQESGYRYREISPGLVKCIDLDEESPLPDDMMVGRASYDDLKAKSHISE
jgi:UDP-2-acetamido-3-amino-2,3-dideoxy-glucuronate N-acetyltransferase